MHWSGEEMIFGSDDADIGTVERTAIHFPLPNCAALYSFFPPAVTCTVVEVRPPQMSTFWSLDAWIATIRPEVGLNLQYNSTLFNVVLAELSSSLEPRRIEEVEPLYLYHLS